MEQQLSMCALDGIGKCISILSSIVFFLAHPSQILIVLEIGKLKGAFS